MFASRSAFGALSALPQSPDSSIRRPQSFSNDTERPMPRIHLKRRPVLVLALAVLSAAASSAEEKSGNDPLVKSVSDFSAANYCALRRYPLMARLSERYVLCLPSRVGAPRDLKIIEVAAVLGKQP